MNDDDLESELRRVLADPSRRLPDSLVPLDVVYAGASRRRARRRAASAVAGSGLAVVAIAAFGAWHVLGGQSAAPSKAGASAVVTPSVLSQSPTASTSSAPSSSPTSTPSAVLAAPVPAGFSPVSVTAISPARWWVLGTDGSVATTSNGGQSFFLVGPAGHSPLGSGATELRFANTLDGWAVTTSPRPGSLRETTDGGTSWQSAPVSGSVSAVEAGRTSVFALTQLNDKTWQVWSATIGKRSSWHALGSLGSLVGPPLLALQSGHAVVAAWNSTGFRVWLYQSSGSAASYAAPCTPDLGADDLSATTGGVWLVCGNGMADSIYRSGDGTVWAKTGVSAMPASRFKVGAIDGSTAAAGLQDGTISVVSGQGLTVPSKGARVTPNSWSYLAFTNKTDGFALGGSGVLLRTVDGGLTWSKVAFS